MPEKRKVKRRFLLYYMRVFESATRKQIGNLVDITPKGIMVVCDKPISDNLFMKLRLELSNEVAEKPWMEFVAISKWCKPDVNPSMYSVGFEILEIDKENAKIIDRIINEFGFRDNVQDR
jgi:hypothetical protein